MIIIHENGLAAYFEVLEKGYLKLYGIKEDNKEAPAPLEKEKGLKRISPETDTVSGDILFHSANILGRAMIDRHTSVIEGTQALKSAFKRHLRDAHFRFGQKLNGVLQAVKHKHSFKADAEDLIEYLGQILIVIADVLRRLPKRNIFLKIIGNIPYELICQRH